MVRISDPIESRFRGSQPNSSQSAKGVRIRVAAQADLTSIHEVFNELVAMQLGRALGLPIPVGFPVEDRGALLYASADVFDGPEVAFTDFSELVICQPRLLCGIALFDAWICNEDRHPEDVVYDLGTSRYFVSGHHHAILGNSGPQHLRRNEGKLGLNAAFAGELRDLSTFNEWYQRLVRIPEYMIMDAVKDASNVGIDKGEAVVAGRLLVARRSSLLTLFQANKALFRSFVPGLFPPFTVDHAPTDYSI